MDQTKFITIGKILIHTVVVTTLKLMIFSYTKIH